MPIETVLALEDISAKEGVVVRAGEAARYTGAGQTAGAARGLALADLVKGQTGGQVKQYCEGAGFPWPEMNDMSQILQEELAVYEANLMQRLAEHEGKCALMKAEGGGLLTRSKPYATGHSNIGTPCWH